MPPPPSSSAPVRSASAWDAPEPGPYPADDDATPLSAAEFAGLMAPLGPFASPPRLAVAVSGGADSLALTLLLSDWLAPRGGRLFAFTVDHGWRAEAAGEAARVGCWLAARGIAHEILKTDSEAASTPRDQAGARELRYRLLQAACAARGVTDLALAHQLEDQAETLLLRLEQGSGADGLAAMAPVARRGGLRLLRPLLSVPRVRLRAFLTACGQPWIEDPSNRDRHYARVRVRARLPDLAARGLDAARLAALARQFGRARALQERETNALLRRAAAWVAPGVLRLEAQLLDRAAPSVARRALARCLMSAGGALRPPRAARLERLARALAGGLTRPATLGGCLVVPRDGALFVAREAGRCRPAPLLPGRSLLWDGRFEVSLAAETGTGPVLVGALGEAGWAELRARPDLDRAALAALRALPHPARLALPAVRSPADSKILAVAGLNDYAFSRSACSAIAPEVERGAYAATGACVSFRFAPRRPLIEEPFTVV